MQLEKLHSPDKLVEEFTSLHEVLWDYCTSPVDPSCPERVCWDILMMVLLMYVTIVLPFRIAFDADAQSGTGACLLATFPPFFQRCSLGLFVNT